MLRSGEIDLGVVNIEMLSEVIGGYQLTQGGGED